MNKLFSPYTIKGIQLKNRIVMSPMCMYSSFKEDGLLTPFHYTHYESRAIGQAGLIMVEATAVLPEGRISQQDLGIWSDDHVAAYQQLNEPLANVRKDAYGGTKENRYRFLKQIIQAVRDIWDGPLFVRISANEYHEKGYDVDDYIDLVKEMKSDGVDLIDCSSGGVVHAQTPIEVYPSYQVRYSETIRLEADIPTGAVGWIRDGNQAEEILRNDRADLVFIGRAMLNNPYWPKQAADDLQVEIEAPKQYKRGWI